MRTNAIYNIIFDRKNQTVKPEDESLIQIEILFVQPNKRMYITTGIYIEKRQWDKTNRQIINHPLAGKYNQRFADIIKKIREHELKLAEFDQQLTKDAVVQLFDPNSGNIPTSSFVAFIEAQINAREESKKIKTAVAYLHRRVLKKLKELKITHFSDLTFQNISRFDDSLDLAVTSKRKQHDAIKTYLKLAENQDPPLADPGKNPYRKFTVKRGKHAIRVRLDDQEMDLIMHKELTNEKLDFQRSLFVFSMFTGLAHRDLSFTPDQLKTSDGKMEIEGLRKKNGEFYSCPVVPPAEEIIRKYGRNIPGKPVFDVPGYEDYKRTLKIVAAAVGIQKNITPHVARHTCGSWLARNNVHIKVIQRILGHVELKTTAIYTDIEDVTANKEVRKAYDKFNEK